MNQPDSTIAGGRVSVGDFILDTSRRHHGLLVVRDGVPVALPDSAFTFGDSFLSNFQASLTSFCVPLFGTLSLPRNPFLSHVLTPFNTLCSKGFSSLSLSQNENGRLF
jgi:hypothetical protein